MEQTGLFNIDTVKSDVEKIKENIKAPYVNAYYSSLGGEKNISVLVTVSLDEKETWANKILENSRYFKLHITNDGRLEMFTKSHKISEKFRKTKVKSVDEAINKINTFINGVNNITEERLDTESNNNPIYKIGDVLKKSNNLRQGVDSYFLILKILEDSYWVSSYVKKFAEESTGHFRIYFSKQNEYEKYNLTAEDIKRWDDRIESINNIASGIGGESEDFKIEKRLFGDINKSLNETYVDETGDLKDFEMNIVDVYEAIKFINKEHDMKLAGRKSPFLWYDDKDINKVISYGVKMGWLNRPSHTQVEWTEKGINEYQKNKSLNESCWKGYKQVGMKKKGNKQVPNCIPNKKKINEYNNDETFKLSKLNEEQFYQLIQFLESDIEILDGLDMDYYSDEIGVDTGILLDLYAEYGYNSHKYKKTDYLKKIYEKETGKSWDDIRELISENKKYNMKKQITYEEKKRVVENYIKSLVNKEVKLIKEEKETKKVIKTYKTEDGTRLEIIEEPNSDRSKTKSTFTIYVNGKGGYGSTDIKTVERMFEKEISKREKLNEEITNKMFAVKVKHDKGTTTIKTNGSDEEDVIKKVMKAEGCPKSAIVSVKEIKKTNENSDMGGRNLRAVKITFDNGDVINTSMAAHLTDDEIKKYYTIGKSFNLGKGEKDLMAKVTKVDILK
jgi:hypothetical protein